jgi:hypothetical protein
MAMEDLLTFTDQNRNRSDNQIGIGIEDRKLRKLHPSFVKFPLLGNSEISLSIETGWRVSSEKWGDSSSFLGTPAHGNSVIAFDKSA